MADFQKTLKELDKCYEALFNKIDDPKERTARRLLIRRCNDVLWDVTLRRHPFSETADRL